MKRTTGYEASDGTKFDTLDACKLHETDLKILILADASADNVKDAINQKDLALADAIELIGKVISTNRRASGNLKRKPKTDAGNTVDVAAEITGENSDVTV